MRRFFISCLALGMVLGFLLRLHAQEQLPKGITLRAVSFPSNSIGYAVGYNGTVVKSSDGGKTWTELNIHYRKSLLTVHFFDENRGVAAGDNQFIIYTGNGGKSWKKADCDCQTPTSAFMTMDFYDDRHGVAAGGQGVVAITKNGGHSWEQVDLPSSAGINFAHMVSPKEIQVIAGHVLFTSNNNGRSFEKHMTNIRNHVMAGKFYNEKIGLLVGSNGSLYKTTNGGQHWMLKSLGDKRTKFRAIDFSGKHIFLTGNFNGVIMSHDGGKSWETKFVQLAKAGKTIYGIEITDDAVIVVGADGFIYRSDNQGLSWKNVSYFL